MAGITARICGICPVSHLIASAKAGDKILAVQVPPGGAKLRRLMNLAQIIQSHALSFFHLSAPDLLLGMESDPAKRNVFRTDRGRAGTGPRRHPPAEVRPGDHRRAGRPEDPPGLVGARRRARAAGRGGPRGDSRRFARSGGHHPRRLGAVQADCSTISRRKTRTFGNFPTLHFGLVTGGRKLGALRWPSALCGCKRNDRRRWTRRLGLPVVHRRSRAAFVVSEIAILSAARLSARASTASARSPA